MIDDALLSYINESLATANHWVDGTSLQSTNQETIPVFCPYNGQVMGSCALGNEFDVEQAVVSARSAQKSWQSVNIKERVQVLYRAKQILERELASLSYLIASECGKTAGEAQAEIKKAVEVIEFAISLANGFTPAHMEVARGVSCTTVREPVGIVACITPANFPVMVPMWTIANILALGNALVLKPSEQVPYSALRLADIFKEAGLPDGLLNIVQGGADVVKSLCQHPQIKVVTFVGSTAIAKQVYAQATSAGKVALALGSSKNHIVLMPDADPSFTAKNIVDSAMGCAGQRCMAASVLISVGDCNHHMKAICDYAKSLQAGRDIGAILNLNSLKRIKNHLHQAVNAGAVLDVDGRKNIAPNLSKYNKLNNGYWLGTSIVSNINQNMPIYKEEIFGPVLLHMQVDKLDEAIQIENDNPFGNAASIFTRDGATAYIAGKRFSSAMVGVNIGIPVPREPFAFGGSGLSKFGSGDITGASAIHLFSQDKKITCKWSLPEEKHWIS